MVWSNTLLQTRYKKYEYESLHKDTQPVEASAPLSIEKILEPMPNILNGVFKKTYHNPNVRAAPNYLVVEELS